MLTDKGAARVPAKGIGRRRLLKNKDAGVLLFWQHGIFHSLADTELQRGFRRNLDRFAGRWVTTFTGLALGFHEFSEAWENKFAI